MAGATVFGCTTGPGPSGTADLSPSAIAPSPSTASAPASQAGATPLESVLATASPTPDRLPAALANRPFLFGDIDATARTIVGRIGAAGRVHLEPGEHVLGVVGDRVVTAIDRDDSTTLRMYVFGSDDVVTETVGGPLVDRPGLVAGKEVLATTRSSDASTAPGIIAISTTTGRVRRVVEPAFITGAKAPVRTMALSADATVLATAICEAGTESTFDCRDTSLVDLATGIARHRVSTGGHPVSNVGPTWLLWRQYAIAGALDRSGATLWEKGTGNDTATYVGYSFVAGDSIIAEVTRSGEPRFNGIVAIDPISGKERILATFTDDHPRRMWLSLSTDTYVALANDDEPEPPCSLDGGSCTLEDDRVIDAGILDLATGNLTEHGIHVTINP